MNLLYVALGGAIGSVLRYLAQLAVGRVAGMAFPYGTLCVNIAGSFAMGVLMGWLVRHTPENAQNIRLFVAVGVLGGFTTFSSFSLDTISLIQDGKVVPASIYIFASVLGSLLALVGGLQLMRTM